VTLRELREYSQTTYSVLPFVVKMFAVESAVEQRQPPNEQPYCPMAADSRWWVVPVEAVLVRVTVHLDDVLRQLWQISLRSSFSRRTSLAEPFLEKTSNRINEDQDLLFVHYVESLSLFADSFFINR
jgi:hypothetical protein